MYEESLFATELMNQYTGRQQWSTILIWRFLETELNHVLTNIFDKLFKFFIV